MKFLKLFLVLILSSNVHAAQNNIMGTLTDTFYLSPNKTFKVNLPVSSHEFTCQDLVNTEKDQEQFTILDDHKMQVSILATRDDSSGKWIQGWYDSLPSKIGGPADSVEMEKQMVVGPKMQKMVLLIKGPIELKNGQIVYIVNGIFDSDGYTFDISASNHYITPEMFGSETKAKQAAYSMAKINFNEFIKNVEFKGINLTRK